MFLKLQTETRKIKRVTETLKRRVTELKRRHKYLSAPDLSFVRTDFNFEVV